MIRAVIFDMDGVIIDSEPLHDRASRRTFEQFDCEDSALTQEDLDAFRGRTEEAFWTHVKEKFHWMHPLPFLVKAKEKQFLHMLEVEPNVQPAQGLRALLGTLKTCGLYVALCSSSAHPVIRSVLRRLDLKEAFYPIISGDDVSQGKPAPDIFLKASQVLNIVPHDCIVIEDSTNGVAAAKAAGMRCIAFQGFAKYQNVSAADFCITAFEELRPETLRLL